MSALTTLSPRRVHASLPIFRLDDDGRALFYTPGDVAVTKVPMADGIEQMLGGAQPESDDVATIAAMLEQRGIAATDAWTALATRPFAPECLTLYLSNRCTLACSYCFSAPDPIRAGRLLRMADDRPDDPELPLLSEDAIAAAARLVAGHCADKVRPFSLVVHGGGEPTLHWSLLTRACDAVQRAADARRLPVWSYIATSGVMPAERARSLARRFSLIGLSCDGPPDIQDAQRPAASGAPTSAIVERTADILAEEGVERQLRVTVTPRSLHRLCDIIDYARDRLGVRSLRLEPSYDAQAGRGGFLAADADRFVEAYLDAAEYARLRGCDLQISGVRQHEIHGPYCNPLRQTLQLTPDGLATACFLSTGAGGPVEARMALGEYDQASGDFRVNAVQAARLQRLAATIPARCEACANVYHCARDCPDVCVMSDDADASREPGFRCLVQKQLGVEAILAMARSARV